MVTLPPTPNSQFLWQKDFLPPTQVEKEQSIEILYISLDPCSSRIYICAYNHRMESRGPDRRGLELVFLGLGGVYYLHAYQGVLASGKAGCDRRDGWDAGAAGRCHGMYVVCRYVMR